MTKIAFIGLGNMGLPMAANLAKGGYEVTCFDVAEDAAERAASAGCSIAETIANAVSSAQVVVTMLPAGSHVRSVYLGAEGVCKNASAGALLIDCSTIDVETARFVSAETSAAGFSMVDAPVSGGVAAATGGTLTFMVGGEAAAFERAREFLDVMGANVFHAGAAGNGQAAKIANNMLLGATMIATCEAFNLA
ncbi:MAG: NAD(P)-binding domain-containing protein, partial [Pseudomonadota bacterium]